VNRPDASSVLVARAPDRLAVIVLREDAAAALELCKELHDLRGEVIIAPRHDTGGDVERQARPMQAKFPGRCAACATAIRVGEPIYYDAESRRAVHSRCA
jgi:hypothetical protein